MIDPLGRTSASSALAVFRRYVTDFVNRHDFSVIGDFMTDDYRIETSGLIVSGRDTAYRAAVGKQLDQFPGLIFTPHELIHVGNRIGVRFTEHGATREGKTAAWPSIAIYSLRNDRMASCAIEQDYFSRRLQLVTGKPSAIDRPAAAPWDTPEVAADPEAERIVEHWLRSGAFVKSNVVQLDDSQFTGVSERIVDGEVIEILETMSGGGKVVFRAVQRGRLAGDFAQDIDPTPGQAVELYMSGFVTVASGAVAEGNIIRDRWGLYRKLKRRAS